MAPNPYQWSVYSPSGEWTGDKPAPDRDRRYARSQSAFVVLYVEDVASNQKLMQRIMRDRQDMRLIQTRSGHDGVATAREERPNLILLDLHLPDLSGEEVLRQLRADERTRDIPVVIISADAMAENIDRLLRAGARDYMVKPIVVKELQTMLDRMVEEDYLCHAPDLPA